MQSRGLSPNLGSCPTDFPLWVGAYGPSSVIMAVAVNEFVLGLIGPRLVHGPQLCLIMCHKARTWHCAWRRDELRLGVRCSPRERHRPPAYRSPHLRFAGPCSMQHTCSDENRLSVSFPAPTRSFAMMFLSHKSPLRIKCVYTNVPSPSASPLLLCSKRSDSGSPAPTAPLEGVGGTDGKSGDGPWPWLCLRVLHALHVDI